MDDITKKFLEQCDQNQKIADTSPDEIYQMPPMTQLEVEEIFAVGGESTVQAAVSIGVSAVSA